MLIYVIWSWKPAPPSQRKMATGEQAALKVDAKKNQVAPEPVALEVA
jgi:hypothetical protein